MLVRKYRVYLMRKRERHYEYVGDRVVSLSDDGRDAWLDVDGMEVHGTVTSDKAFAGHPSSHRGRISDLYLREQ
jgi:hypothetical protein